MHKMITKQKSYALYMPVKKHTRKKLQQPTTTIINNIQYPFYKDSYKLSIARIINIVNKLQKQLYIYNILPINYYKQEKKDKINKLLLNNSKPQFYIIKSLWKNNLELNSLTDYFTEQCRVQCIFKNNMSPITYWNKHYKTIISHLKRNNKSITNYNLREEMYFRNKPCNNFRISVCLEVLKLFKPKTWLDISAGWGDRLLSALLYKPLKLYCGVDPNPCLHPYYNEMINTFTTKQDNREFILIQDGFETATLPEIKFDLVFSSPPFFDLEKYSNSNSNSLVKYNKEDTWFNGFLIPSINKAIQYLALNGYLILYMGESYGTKYIPKMIELVDKQLKNIGIFYYTDDGSKLRKFYCWTKQ